MKHIFLFSFLVFHTYSLKAQFFSDKENIKKKEGFVTFYYDENNGKIYLEVDKLEEEFLYINSLSQGVGSNDIGLDRGQLGNSVIVKFVKYGDKIMLLQPNKDYRAISDNREEQKSVEEAFAKSILYGFKIVDTKQNTFLVDATNFLLQDAHGVSTKLQRLKEGNYSLDKSKSAIHIERTKSFPNNTEFDAILTFNGKPMGSHLSTVTPNPSNVTVHQHHSFVALPDSGYKPRKHDPRCGSWPMMYMDYATPVNQSIQKRFIYRHRLEKKDPNAKISEAKKPIVYYLDRGTPEPVRSALLDGARWWNEAFEAAGYKNAFQVKMLPEGADPMDIRYNMIQWVHRSTRGWSYGASVSDPRTGEILKGHVSLGSLRIRQDFLIAQALQAPYKKNTSEDDFALEMALARVRQLSAHEIGHTLGFAHNFAASTNGRSSVMDYPHPKLSLKNGNIDFSNAYDTKIGDWDKITVQYAYGDFKEEEEEEKLQAILKNAFSKGFRFISDADARPISSSNANAHLWDNGEDLLKEFENVLEVRAKAIENFSTDNIKDGEPYSVLEDVFVPLYFFHRYQTEAISKLIGGLEYTYAVKGQNELVVHNVKGRTEREALKAILKTIDVNHIAIPKKLLGLFPPRAYGYGRTRESFSSKNGGSFDAFGAVQTNANFTMKFLLNPERINRMVQHQSLDKSQLGVSELLDSLVKKTFGKRFEDNYLQSLHEVVKTEVLYALFDLANSSILYPQASALVDRYLEKIGKEVQKDFTAKNGDENEKGALHFDTEETNTVMDGFYLKLLMEFKRNPKDTRKTNAPRIPDGSPIGSY